MRGRVPGALARETGAGASGADLPAYNEDAENVLRGLPVAVVGASAGQHGAVWAQADLRKVLRATGADVLDAELAVGNAAAAFTEEGRLLDPELANALR